MSASARAALLAVLLLAFPACLAAQPAGDLVMPALSAQGSVQGQGDLLGMYMVPPPAAFAGASLSASRIDFLFETVQDQLVVEEVATVRTSADVVTSSGAWSNATLNLTRIDQEGYLFLQTDAATAIWQGDSSALGATAAAMEEPSKGRDMQAPLTFSGPAADLSGDLSRMDVSGSFTLALWGIDGQVRHDGGTTEVQTGFHDGATGLPLDVAEETWLYVTVTNGTLRLGAHALPGGMVFLEGSGNASVTGNIQGTAYAGDFLGSAVHTAEDVRAVGRLDLSWRQRDAATLDVSVGGDLTDAQLAGRTLSTAAQAQGPASPWAWAVGSAILLVTAAGAVLVRRARHDPLERLLARGQWEKATRIATARLGGRDDTQARCALVVSLLRRELPAQALEVLQAGRLHPGTRGMLQAQALAMLGREAEARRVLGQCMAQAPQLRAQARQNPVLARLLGSGAPGYA